MAHVPQHRDPISPRTFGSGYLFGVPLGDLGWFTSLLMSFALGFADVPYLVGLGPQTVTLGATGNAADTSTSGQVSSLGLSFANQDTTPTKALYACVVAQGTPNFPTTGDLTAQAGNTAD